MGPRRVDSRHDATRRKAKLCTEKVVVIRRHVIGHNGVATDGRIIDAPVDRENATDTVGRIEIGPGRSGGVAADRGTDEIKLKRTQAANVAARVAADG